ncbi:MAG: saccharopine dehydrogenase family protein [Alphaproteobacteria bacterium]
MQKILLIGGGKIGRMISHFLGDCEDYALTVADASDHAPAGFARRGLDTLKLDANDDEELRAGVQGFDHVISACPYYLTVGIAAAAAAAGAHYFDLTEDVASTAEVKNIAGAARSAMMPQCGLAPDFVSIVAADLATRFEDLEDLHLRVGALPKYPTNALKYKLTWSTDGLINEYLNPCEALVDGEYRQTAALEGREHFSLDGVEYEAFNTSGGLGTLHETLAGKVRNLNYRTVRYPGHLDIIRMLVNDLKLRDRPALLKDILETALPMTTQDVVLVFVSASGHRDGRFVQESEVYKIFGRDVGGEPWSAIQITTAAGICAVLDLITAGKLPQQGFVRQEQVALDDFLANRFGRFYTAA